MGVQNCDVNLGAKSKNVLIFFVDLQNEKGENSNVLAFSKSEIQDASLMKGRSHIKN